jgi:hypothetical protein
MSFQDEAGAQDHGAAAGRVDLGPGYAPDDEPDLDTFEEGLTDASAAPAVLSASDLKRLLAQIDRLETASRSTKPASTFYPGTSGNKIHVDDVCMLTGCGRTKWPDQDFCGKTHARLYLDGGYATAPRSNDGFDMRRSSRVGAPPAHPARRLDQQPATGNFYDALGSPRGSNAGSEGLGLPPAQEAQSDFGVRHPNGIFPGFSEAWQGHWQNASDERKKRFTHEEMCAFGKLQDLGRTEIDHLNSIGLVLDIMPLDSVEFDVLSSLQGSVEGSLNKIRGMCDVYTLRFNYHPDRYAKFRAMSKHYEDRDSDLPRCMLADNLHLVHQVDMSDLQQTRRDLRSTSAKAAPSRAGNTSRYTDVAASRDRRPAAARPREGPAGTPAATQAQTRSKTPAAAATAAAATTK